MLVELADEGKCTLLSTCLHCDVFLVSSLWRNIYMKLREDLAGTYLSVIF
jgi:hypothetical protein